TANILNHRLYLAGKCFFLFHLAQNPITLPFPPNRPKDGCMKHDDIWRALDTLAAENGLSASGLARRSGLDPTTFNPSKRRMPDGRARWPSTESIAKVLDATGASLEGFTALVAGARALSSNAARAVARRIPLIGMAQAGDDGHFDDAGFP